MQMSRLCDFLLSAASLKNEAYKSSSLSRKCVCSQTCLKEKILFSLSCLFRYMWNRVTHTGTQITQTWPKEYTKVTNRKRERMNGWNKIEYNETPDSSQARTKKQRIFSYFIHFINGNFETLKNILRTK